MKVHKSEHRGSSHAEKLSEERRVGGPPSFVASAGFGATLAELIIGVAGGGWGGGGGTERLAGLSPHQGLSTVAAKWVKDVQL